MFFAPQEHARPAASNVDLAAGSVDVLPCTQLVASVEPSVVFTSLAAQCVPDLCDECTIDVFDGAHARYRIVFPPRTTCTGGLLRLADRAGAAPDHRVQVPFIHPQRAGTTRVEHLETGAREEFRGVATFVWHRRVPTRSDHIAAAALVDRALQTVRWQRSEPAAVGILMNQHKITDEKAFDLLAQASHHYNRKLRDLADEVVDTGWLDPQRATESGHATAGGQAGNREDESPN